MKKISLIMLWIILAGYTAFVKADIPRPEYPRPQFERESWINLNGEWTYAFDFGKSGYNRKLYESTGLKNTILVPFCPESKLSGVEYTDFINAMWYHRTLQLPAYWNEKKIMLNFGAVDYYAAVYIDGKLAGRHWGGSSSFSLDITKLVVPGNIHNLVVYVEDDNRSGKQARGKQSENFYSQGCDYTRTTGIWQTVWVEAIHPQGLKHCYIVPEPDQKRFIVYPEFYALQTGQKLRIRLKEGGKVIHTALIPAASPSFAELPVKTVKTWSPEAPFLYDLEFEVLDKNGNVVDFVKSYAGLRKIHIEGDRYFLNNQPYYQRLVLDQGFYPEGVWTAPSDAALKHDIELSMAAGFNGARLHQKVFEERFHYWADKLGYLTWGESASWGCDMNDPEAARNFITEWQEIVLRDRNHPSIIVWTPFNETWQRPNEQENAKQHDRFVSDIYKLTHGIDYRPLNDASGNFHVVTDIWTVHDYEQNPDRLREKLSIKEGVYPQYDKNKEVLYDGQPYFVDEYGGIKWITGQQYAGNSWGYGDEPKSEEEFYQRSQGITDVILEFKHISGYCYTQLTDVKQEQNGIYNYDRTAKFDMSRIHSIFSKVPAGYANSTQD